MRFTALAQALAATLLAVSAAAAATDSTRVAPLVAQAAPPADHGPMLNPSLDVHATRLTGSISVDGSLSEPVWQLAEPSTRFLQSDPHEGQPATERTEVRVVYDDEAIYIGARMYDAHPDSIIARLARRDATVQADRFTVFFDPFHDKRSGYYFAVNAAGVLSDGTLFNDGWDDNSWDGVWEARAKIDKDGWTAEMRIPFSQMRFEKRERTVWGVDFRREITRRSEVDFLVYQPKKESGFCSRFPELLGMDDVRPARAIELLPYVTGKAEYMLHDPGDPFHQDANYVPSGGADLRMGVGHQLTLNATANPDFGQVEVDPAVVNLSDVETFYPEKRPFFTENSRIFSFGNEGANDYWNFNWPDPLFFYSRRIGHAPEGTVPDDATYSDVPLTTTILGAAKLTGKLGPGWNFGTLHAITGREEARIAGSSFGTTADVEPLTYYGVVRGQREFTNRHTGLGSMVEVVARDFGQDRLRDQFNSSSVVAGLDGWRFLDKKEVWVVSGWASASNVRGNPTRMIDVQENSLHYFQRPDAGHVSLDSSMTSMTGYGARLWLNKQKGNWLSNSAIGFMTPQFDVNDLGFQSRGDIINAHIGGGYRWTNVTSWRKYAHIIAALYNGRDFDGNTTSHGIWSGMNLELYNNWSNQVNLLYAPQSMNPRKTRGGPVMVNPAVAQFYQYWDTDSKRKMFYFIETGGTFDAARSQDYWTNPGIEWKPVSNITLRVGPGFERNIQDSQYVTALSDPSATQTYGNRYVMAELDQTTISGNFRLNWSFTPTMSLETFIQPLVSSGRYFDYKSLARPRTYDFDPLAVGSYDPPSNQITLVGPGGALASFDRPDFNFMSLRGNAVFRWEYMPGSTLFFVWTQERSDNENTGEFDAGQSFHQLTGMPANNVFMVKLTYYLNR